MTPNRNLRIHNAHILWSSPSTIMCPYCTQHFRNRGGHTKHILYEHIMMLNLMRAILLCHHRPFHTCHLVLQVQFLPITCCLLHCILLLCCPLHCLLHHCLLHRCLLHCHLHCLLYRCHHLPTICHHHSMEVSRLLP